MGPFLLTSNGCHEHTSLTGPSTMHSSSDRQVDSRGGSFPEKKNSPFDRILSQHLEKHLSKPQTDNNNRSKEEKEKESAAGSP